MARKNDTADASAPLARARTAWVVSDGTTGMEVQSVGLAERMGLKTRLVRVSASSPIARLPRLALLPFMPLPSPLRDAAREGWPDVVVTTGRRMSGYSILARRMSGGATRSIHIQDPRLPPRHFDWMVVPSHDRARGANVLVTTGSLNALTPAKIKAAAGKLDHRIRELPGPVIAFMVGGSNRRYRVHRRDYRGLGEYAAAMAAATGASLVFIPSRRSPADAGDAIRSAVGGAGGNPAFHVWDGTGENPYPGILGLAAAVVVTSDSVNMTSEACLSGKPVYRYEFRGETGRIGLFHRIMEEGGYTRDARALAPHAFPDAPGAMLDETGRIAGLLTGRGR